MSVLTLPTVRRRPRRARSAAEHRVGDPRAERPEVVPDDYIPSGTADLWRSARRPLAR